MAYVSAGIMTVNEVRAGMGLPPVSWGNVPAPSPVKKNVSGGLRKDDGEDDEEDDEDEESDDDEEFEDEDEKNADDNTSDFNAKHPRWPAGSPDGTGGEFAPKDGGVAATGDTANTTTGTDTVTPTPATTYPNGISPAQIRDMVDRSRANPIDISNDVQVAMDDSTQTDVAPLQIPSKPTNAPAGTQVASAVDVLPVGAALATAIAAGIIVQNVKPVPFNTDSGSETSQSGDASEPKTIQDITADSVPDPDNPTLTNGAPQRIKSGDMDTAYQDFNSLQPSNVQNKGEGKIVGTLSDGNTVIARPLSEPTLEVKNTDTGRPIIKIRYRK